LKGEKRGKEGKKRALPVNLTLFSSKRGRNCHRNNRESRKGGEKRRKGKDSFFFPAAEPRPLKIKKGEEEKT